MATTLTTNRETIREIVVAKPMRLYAEALGAVCGRVFPGANVRVYWRARDMLAALRAEPADVLVLGLAFSDVDGLDLLGPIANEKLARHVLVDTPRRDDYSLFMLRSARFDGFIDAASEGIEALNEALRRIAGGQSYISEVVRPELVDRPSPTSACHRLTRAEIHVLRVIGDGSDNDEGAKRLGLTASTVQTHRRNIMRKLGVSTSAKLVREAVRLGIVRITPRGVFRRGDAAAVEVKESASDVGK